MANIKETNNANNPSYYSTMALGIFVIMAGVLLRFVGDSQLIDVISNVIFIVGVLIGLSAVNKILK